MKGDIQNIKVGFFVFMALAVGAFMIFMVGSDKRVFESRYKLTCTFANISGLRIGAPVQLAGINVGFVENIKFPKDLLKKEIEVVLMIANRYKDRIREDSIATINTQGLLGDKFIFVSIGSPEEPELANGGALKTKETVGLFELAEKGGDILEDLRSAASELSKVMGDLSEGRGDINDIVKSVKNVLNEAEKGKGLIHALVYDPKGEEILSNLSDSMASLRILLGQTDEGAMKRSRMKDIAFNLNKMAVNLSGIAEKVNRGEGTLGGIITDPTIYNEIRSIFGKADRNSLFKTVVRATLRENEKQVLK